MTGNKSSLVNFKNIEGPKVVFGGKDRYGQTKGIGIVERNGLKIEDVSYVEGLKFNLFSTSQFCDKGYLVEFFKDKCLVKNETTGEIVLQGTRKRNMYVVDWSTTKESICLVANNTNATSWEWHKKLNHLNFKTINKLAANDLVKGLPKIVYKKDQICDACQRGKQIKSSFKSKSQESSSRPLSLLHMDLFGPVDPVSMSGKKYTLVIVDDFSRYTWTIFLNKKNEVERKLPELLKQLQIEKELKIAKIRTDRGTEFVNGVIQDYCSMQGILHQLSAARTPQQNGVAERRIRTLKEAARVMITAADLPKRFWAEAINTACYTQNRSLINKLHNKTPYELWKGRKPNLSYFHSFGCKCFVHVNGKTHLKTFDERADEAIFLGYSSTSRAFRVLNKSTMVVEESIHVVFDESTKIEEADVSKNVQNNFSDTNDASENEILQGINELELNNSKSGGTHVTSAQNEAGINLHEDEANPNQEDEINPIQGIGVNLN